MAKKTQNKSENIRQYIGKHPTATAAEIAKALGVPVGLVYSVKAASKKKKTGEMPGRPPGRPARAPQNGSAASEPIFLAAAFVKSCGGLSAARSAIDAVEKVAASIK